MDPTSLRPIGDTGLSVSAMGLGAAQVGGLFRPMPEAEGRAIVEEAIQAGLRYVDTAPFYGYGLSERRVGDVLRGCDPAAWVLSTKVGRRLKPHHDPADPDDQWPDPLPFRAEFDYSYDGVMRSYEASLHRLGLPRIDILFLHDIGQVTHGDDHADHTDAALTGGYRALDELRRNGDIRAFGIGANEWEICDHALDFGRWDVFLLAGRYTLLEQTPLDRFLPRCREHGARVVVGGPFNSGILAGGDTWNYEAAPADIVERVDRLRQICTAHDVPLPAAALQFPLAHPAVVSVIPGLQSIEELHANVAMMADRIPSGLWDDLRQAGCLHPDAPTPPD